MMKTVRSICPYDCPCSCGLLLNVENGSLLSTTGDPEHPACKGLICGKMRNYERGVNHPDRLKKPLIRTGAKGSGMFREASWEEAVRLITEKWQSILRESGPESIAYCYYSGVMSIVQRYGMEALFAKMGACQLEATLCSSGKGAGYAAVVGKTGCLDPRELEDSDLYILWSSQVKATRLQILPTLTEARKKGKKILLVDVYAEETADLCDEIFLIRPGSDGALALAVMKVLKDQGLADEAYLKENAEGFEDFFASLDMYTLSWAEEKTGLSADSIEKLAILYGRAAAPASVLGSGFSRYGNGGMNARLITILSLFTGAWKRPGGGLCGCNPSGSAYVDKNKISRPDFRKHVDRSEDSDQPGSRENPVQSANSNQPGSREHPARKININCLGAELEKETIRSLYVWGCNPANSVSDAEAVRRGLMREDLFTVVHERFLTDTALLADVVLPATYSPEQTDVYTSYGYRTLGLAKKAVNAPGEALSNWDTMRLLAKGMGYTDSYFLQTEEEAARMLLDTSPAVQALPEEVRARLYEGNVVSMPKEEAGIWRTPSGKIQIRNEALSVPLPGYVPCYSESEGRKQEDHLHHAEGEERKQEDRLHHAECEGEETSKNTQFFHLISAPSIYTLNTVFAERDDLNEKRGPMKLVMHELDAEAHGIREGDWVLAANDLAEVEFIAHLTDKISRGTAAAVGVYSRGMSFNGKTANSLHHARLTDLGAGTTMNDNVVQLRLLFTGQ